MATPRKKPTSKKVVTVKEDEYTPLEMHAIKLNEMYKAFRKAGFPTDQCLWLITEPGALPDWFQPTPSYDPIEDDEEEY
jgi:hypothetical protein